MRMIHETKAEASVFLRFALFYCVSSSECMHSVGSPDASMPQAVQQNGNHKVTGRVVDSAGEPRRWIRHYYGGGTRKVLAATDDGQLLSIPSKAKLVISYVGYTRQSLWATRPPLMLRLKKLQILWMGIWAALGYIKRCWKLLGYDESVGSNELTCKDANFVNSLNGKVAGC